ncbi:DUF2171 domain-containing protein, partial [Rhizobium leguminosarum]
MISADQIREHMEVRAADGTHVGTVDHLDGTTRIKPAGRTCILDNAE